MSSVKDCVQSLLPACRARRGGENNKRQTRHEFRRVEVHVTGRVAPRVLFWTTLQSYHRFNKYLSLRLPVSGGGFYDSKSNIYGADK